MTATEVIQSTVATSHLAESRRLAVAMVVELERLIDRGYDLVLLRSELYTLFHKYRDADDRVARDALVEVIEEIEERLAAQPIA